MSGLTLFFGALCLALIAVLFLLAQMGRYLEDHRNRLEQADCSVMDLQQAVDTLNGAVDRLDDFVNGPVIRDIKTLFDKIAGLASCNDTLVIRTRRNEGLLNELNSRLTKSEQKVSETDGLSDQLQHWITDFTTRLDNLAVQLNVTWNKADHTAHCLTADKNRLDGRIDWACEEVVALDSALVGHKDAVNKAIASIEARITKVPAMDKNAADLAYRLEVLEAAEKQLRGFAHSDMTCITALKAETDSLKAKVRQLEEDSRMDFAAINKLKDTVACIFPEVRA